MNLDQLFFIALSNFIEEQGEASQKPVFTLFFCYLVSNTIQRPLQRKHFPQLLEACSPKTRAGLLATLNALDEDLLQSIIQLFEKHQGASIFSTTIDSALHQFYPQFLKEYKKERWKNLGAFYTDPIVARFMIRQIDQFWQDEYGFNLANSPAELTKILDPALGSAVFLSEAIRLIREQKKQAWHAKSREEQIKNWAIYLQAPKTGLLHRMLGFELDEFALLIGEFRLSWLLFADKELPFSFSETASLPLSQSDALLGQLPFSPTLVLGNPPYNSTSKQKTEWIGSKIDDYKYIDGQHFGEKKHWLSDDYIKFIRLGHHYLQAQKQGVLSFITPNGFLRGPSFRAMRWNLLQEFSFLRILDLQGNHHQTLNQEDENLFEIQQGITIFLFGKCPHQSKQEAALFSFSYSGSKESKLQLLQNEALISWKKHQPEAPFYSFLPLNISSSYQKGFSLQKLFLQYSTGLQTGNEDALTASTPEELQARFSLQTRKNIIPYLHKPFQIRALLYVPSSQKAQFPSIPFPKSYRIREKISKHMLVENNIALHFARSNKSKTIDHFFISHYCADLKAVEKTTGSVFAPLYTINGSHNLNTAITEKITEILTTEPPSFAILDYVYAVLYSPIYRERYKEELSIDYPRIFYPKDKTHFLSLQKLGRELRLYHLQEHPNLLNAPKRFCGHGSNQISKIHHKEKQLFINKTQYFFPVSPEVFNFQIGGYPVIKKWLKDHRDQELTPSQIEQLNQIIFILEQTIQLMQKIARIKIS